MFLRARSRAHLDGHSLIRMDQRTGTGQLQYNEHQLSIDTSLLGSTVPLRIGSVYMLIGEILQQVCPVVPVRSLFAASIDVRLQGDNYALRPRVARNVDGMDFDLFERALRVRRDFEAELLAKRAFEV